MTKRARIRGKSPATFERWRLVAEKLKDKKAAKAINQLRRAS